MFSNYKQWRTKVGAPANRNRPTCEARTRPGHRGVIGPPGCVVRKRQSDNGQQIREVNRLGQTIHKRQAISLRANQTNVFSDHVWLRLRNPSNNQSLRIHFKVDTGADRSTISHAHAQTLGLYTHPPPGVKGVNVLVANGQSNQASIASLPLSWTLRGKTKTRNVEVIWGPNTAQNLLGLTTLRAFRVHLV